MDLELGCRPLNFDVEVHDDGSITVTDDGPGIGPSLDHLLVHGYATPTTNVSSMFLPPPGPGRLYKTRPSTAV